MLTGDGLPTMWCGYSLETIERFAQLVQAAEREACAKECEAIENEALEHLSSTIDERDVFDHSVAPVAAKCAEAIRARGDDA